MLQDNKVKIFYKNRKILVFLFSLFLFFCFVSPLFAMPGEGLVVWTIGKLVNIIVWFCGAIISLVISAVVHIAQYNNFINEKIIINGWTIVRDLCNMFFILILLVIAFATILKVENYSVKKLLPKLLIMAVLINFSRTICGLIIDFGQVIMLTFVNAIGNTGGNFANTLGVQSYLSMVSDKAWDDDINLISTLGGMLAGIIFLLIASVTLIALLAILAMRIVMLWIYIVLSPLAFLASAFPAGQKYVSQWWGDFTKQVIVGPVLAFFLWLALMSANTIGDSLGSGACFGPNQILCPDQFLNFIVAIGMLVGGMMVAQQMGGAAGSIAGKGISWAKGVGKGLGKGSLMGLDWINRKQAAGFTGFDLNPFRQAQRIKASLDRSKARDLSDADAKASARLKKGGWTGAIGGFTATGWGDQHLRGLLGYRGFMSAVRGSEGNVEKWRKEEKENEWMAEHSFETSGKYNNKLKELKIERTKEGKGGNITRVAELNEEIKKMEEMGDKLIGKDKKTKYEKEATKNRGLADKYTVVDYEGLKARRIAENEERSKITSHNEDELIAQFGNALSHDNKSLAGALAKAIAEVGGGNALLKKYGYNVTAGLTEKEVKGMSEKEVLEKRGFNDFMRDIFEDKLGLDRQSTLALQSDLGGIGENIGHDYLIKSVGVDDQGRFYQSSKEKRDRVKTEEKLKREPEGVIRKNNRLEYGAENIHTGDFEWSNPGMATFIANIDIVNKEIDGKRFNRSAAKAITEDEALDKLKQKLTKLGTVIRDKEGNPINTDEFLEKLKEYGRQASKDKLDKLLVE